MEGTALGNIDHFVVLMLENRSFDNMLGWLDAPDNPPPFRPLPGAPRVDGLAGGPRANPVPPDLPGAPGLVRAGRAAHPRTPDPDPGEGYAHTHVQLYGRPPGPQESADPAPAPMDGFVRDYIDVLRADGRALTPAEYGQIMDAFPPASVPVISILARAYAVCDRWHCSVPSETLPNRAFALAATSGGMVDNTPYTRWLSLDAPTICNRLQDARVPGLTWRVYYDLADVLPATWLLFPRLRPFLLSHFSGMDTFLRDAAAGTLPSFALIEPRFFLDPNDQHPPASVLPGEQLVHRVYQALRQGAGWERTLLLITYDEHGGCYDHVPPPPAVPPDPAAPPGQYGFRFDRLGVRVPAVLVSPWIEAGTVFRAQGPDGAERALDHTSWLRTVERRFGLAPLTDRDAAAPDVAAALGRSHRRADAPVLPPPGPAAPGPSPTASTAAASWRALAAARVAAPHAGDAVAGERLRRMLGG
jgi:phospholipase C